MIKLKIHLIKYSKNIRTIFIKIMPNIRVDWVNCYETESKKKINIIEINFPPKYVRVKG